MTAGFSNTLHETIETVDREEVVHDTTLHQTSHADFEIEMVETSSGGSITTIEATGGTSRENTSQRTLSEETVFGNFNSGWEASMHIATATDNTWYVSSNNASQTYRFHRSLLPSPGPYQLDELDGQHSDSEAEVDENGQVIASVGSSGAYDETSPDWDSYLSFETAQAAPLNLTLPELFLWDPLGAVYGAGGLPTAGAPVTASGPLEGGGPWEGSDNGLNWSYKEFDAQGNLTRHESGRHGQSAGEGYAAATGTVISALHDNHPIDLPAGENLPPITADDALAPTDIDGDGTPDAVNGDMDGDGTPNDEDFDRDGDGIPDTVDRAPDRNDHFAVEPRNRAQRRIGLSELDDFTDGAWEGFQQGLADTWETIQTLPGQIKDGLSWVWDRVTDPVGTAKSAGRLALRGMKGAFQVKRLTDELERLMVTDPATLYKLLTGDTEGLEGTVSPELLLISQIAREVVGAVHELYDDWDEKSPEEQAEILGKVFGYVAYNVAEGVVAAGLTAGLGAGAKILKSGKMAQGLAELLDTPGLASKIESVLARIAQRIEVDTNTASMLGTGGVRLRKTATHSRRLADDLIAKEYPRPPGYQAGHIVPTNVFTKRSPAVQKRNQNRARKVQQISRREVARRRN